MEEGRRGIVEDGNIIFVAVGKELRKYRSTLEWVLQRWLDSPGVWRQINIIYVHIPSQMIPVSSGEQDLANVREQERKEMVQTVDSYVEEIDKIGQEIPTTGIYHSASSIEKGIVEVISQKRVRRLIMGGATDSGYHRKMTEPTSTKSKYVHQHAPDFCQIQFVCKGELIYTREAVEASNPDFEQTPSDVLGINEPDTGVTPSDMLGINEPDTGAENSGNDNRYDQLEKTIPRTGYSIRQQKPEIEEICQEYLAKMLCDLKLERDEALKEAEQLRKQLAEKPSTPKFFSYFSTSDVMKATNNFDASTIIALGGYGSVYKGLVGDTEVAIKVLNPDGRQGSLEFQREMDALSNLYHPNLVTLIGACLETRALIYLYLRGGSLEDRITCKDSSPPLHWQTRIRIAIELCSVIAFLHSNAHCSIIHGDLKPSNILLDENLVCKLGDFGTCHLSPRTEENFTSSYTSVITQPRGTHGYWDPEFAGTGVLSKKSDVYSIGVILLQLLTGQPSIGIADKVRKAWASDNNSNSILDPSAGEWPSFQAVELARVALQCCDVRKSERPDLDSVLRFLKLIKALCMGLSTHQVFSDDDPPTHFLCPIFQEIMEDPHFASDGFTYDKNAIEGWLEFGRDSSPMTNDPLQDTNIVPNRALRSAIQEWLQQKDSV